MSVALGSLSHLASKVYLLFYIRCGRSGCVTFFPHYLGKAVVKTLWIINYAFECSERVLSETAYSKKNAATYCHKYTYVCTYIKGKVNPLAPYFFNFSTPVFKM
jgi:hypothetical protein